MSHSASTRQLGSQFDEFLFAPIGDDRSGMPLSVLSALARLDVDPWREAANLAQLPSGTATERLATLIAALPDRLLASPDLRAIAARVIDLLPRQTGVDVKSCERLVDDDPANNLRAVVRVILINVIFMALVLGAQSIMATHSPPAHTDADRPPISTTVAPHLPPSSLDK